LWISEQSKFGVRIDFAKKKINQVYLIIHCFPILKSLLEDRFTEGIYRGTFRHEPDLDLILKRAADVGVKRIVLTAGTVTESRKAVEAARSWQTTYGSNIDLQFTCTVGVHPTRCKQVFVDGDSSDENDNKKPDDEGLLQELLDIATDGMKDGTVVAIGEIGLDYDRLEFCPADIQKKYLIRQLEVLATNTGLPLFLHNRSVRSELFTILKEHSNCWKRGGVVHSFDDTKELAMKFIEDLGLYIGLNGCSLRTPENLETASQLPLDRILLETE
jgi:TatD DNase family protein